MKLMNPGNELPGTPNSWFRWIIHSRICRVFALLCTVTVVLLLASWFREYSRSQAIKQRLTGTWKEEGIRVDGSTYSAIWEFRTDGTVRNHLVGKPMRESGRLDDYMQWKISRGELVLSWDHQFTREASVGQRVMQVTSFLDDRWRRNNHILAYSDRCLIQDNGGDVITLIPHVTARTDGTAVGGYVKQPIRLVRVNVAP